MDNLIRPPTAPATSARLNPWLAATLLFVMPVAHASASEPAWEYEETEDGIALYTGEVREHSYDVVKAVITLDASPAQLLGLLRDIERYPSWYYRCKQTRVLQRPATLPPVQLTADGRFVPQAVDESYVLFFLQATPSIEDRWAVVKNSVRIERDGSLLIAFSSLDNYAYRAPEGAVRMRLRGRWQLTPLSRTRTRVTLVLNIDPDTSTPAFLVDPKIHDTAVETLRNLRRLALPARSASSPRTVRRSSALALRSRRG